MSMTIGKGGQAITVQGHSDFWKDAYLVAYKGQDMGQVEARLCLEGHTTVGDVITAASGAAAHAADCALRAFAERMSGRVTVTRKDGEGVDG